MKRLSFIFVLFLQPLFLQAQKNDSIIQQKYFSVSTDLAQYLLYQPNIGVEYRYNRRVAFGANVGYVNPDPEFTVNILADGQYKMPGTVYNGPALRLYCKYYRTKKPDAYWSAQLVAKYLWYNNVRFMDQIPETDDGFNYTMDEKSVVLGLEFLHGHEWISQRWHFYLDLFYGLGVHIRLRNFTVIDNVNQQGIYLPAGYYKGYISYPTPVIGLKFGYCFKY